MLSLWSERCLTSVFQFELIVSQNKKRKFWTDFSLSNHQMQRIFLTLSDKFLCRNQSAIPPRQIDSFCPNLENALKLKNSFFSGGSKIGLVLGFFLQKWVNKVSLSLSHSTLTFEHKLVEQTESVVRQILLKKFWTIRSKILLNNELQIDVLTFYYR